MKRKSYNLNFSTCRCIFFSKANTHGYSENGCSACVDFFKDSSRFLIEPPSTLARMPLQSTQVTEDIFTGCIFNLLTQQACLALCLLPNFYVYRYKYPIHNLCFRKHLSTTYIKIYIILAKDSKIEEQINQETVIVPKQEM